MLSLGYSAPFEVPYGALDIRPFLILEPKFYGRSFLLASGGEYLRNINGRVFQCKRALLACEVFKNQIMIDCIDKGFHVKEL